MNASKKIRTIAALGTLSGAVWAGTFATFTDTSVASGSTFATGTLDLVVGGDADDAVAFTTLSMSNMKPGDATYAALTMSNAGSLPFDYTMSTAVTNAALSGQLTLTVRTVAAAVDCAAATFNAVTTASVSTATALSSGAIAARRLAAAPATLPAVSAEVLCFKVELPSGTTDTFQGQTTDATFTFSATQT